MLTRFAARSISLAVLMTSVMAGPLYHRPSGTLAARTDFCSFDNWRGISSLNDFDNFYGVENFDGSQSVQVIVQPDHELVCHPQSVQIVQQRLLVLQEVAKMIITEQICDVETQTIVFEQWHSGLHGFSRDLRRHTGRHVGYDRKIVSHHDAIFDQYGLLTFNDFGFNGHDLGKETIIVNGHNWDDARSPVTVEDAYRATRDAYHVIHSDLI